MNQDNHLSSLTSTYFHLALAVPGTVRLQENGFEGCTGPLRHSLCNFALNLRPDLPTARRLAEVAAQHAGFTVYRPPGENARQLDSLLDAVGFRLEYVLAHMTAPGRSTSGIPVEKAYACERQAVAAFMGSQFLLRHDPGTRAAMVHAVANAQALDLYSMKRQGKVVAAVMLCHANGVCGVYNLCVASAHRGQGIGSSLVRWALNEAYERGEDVALQCEAKLAGWYRTFGFAEVGALKVYDLAKGLPNDIIEIV